MVPVYFLTSKHPWIVDIVVVHRIPGHCAYFESTSDCIFFTQGSRALGLLRNDFGLQIFSLYTGPRGICLTLKRSWIPDFVVVYETPGYSAYFETRSNCRFCRYIRDSGASCLLRNDLGLQILCGYILDSRAFGLFRKEPRRARESPGEPRRRT
jgi:hypothetical protein